MSVLIPSSLSYRYPPDTEEKQKGVGNFFGTFPPPKIAGLVPDYVKAVQTKDSSIAKFGIIGVRHPLH